MTHAKGATVYRKRIYFLIQNENKHSSAQKKRGAKMTNNEKIVELLTSIDKKLEEQNKSLFYIERAFQRLLEAKNGDFTNEERW